MKNYKDINNDSGIESYEYGDDWIAVKFKSGKTFKYEARNIGSGNLSAMKSKADAGDGLHSFINKNKTVKDGYSR